ncbi:monocarboxylate transporter [Aspergillus avenaceus]|uniref:Monocarboxylate transporter n=1 Tax=Aspergillus avenaceus TaxID=36643 RepID=A0A5N6TTW6_ASPAV|nr:monocarboxylate transporter [Aspergillus avenaceus]
MHPSEGPVHFSHLEIDHSVNSSGFTTPRNERTDSRWEESLVGARSGDVADSFPDGGYRSWLVVLGSFLLLMSSYGLMNSVGVLQSYLESHQLSNYSSQNVGWISGVFVFIALGLGVFVGPLFDTYGPRELVSAGSCFYVVSLFLTAECTEYWHFMLCFGLMSGIGGAFTSTVGMSCVPHWFQARAGMALGTAMAGAGLGGVVFPFILKGTFANLGFKWGMRVLAFVILVLSGLGSFLVKSRLPKGQLKAAIDIRCFRDARFTLLSFGIFSKCSSFCPVASVSLIVTALELEVFALIGLYPTFVKQQGFSTSASVYTLVVLNICSCVGRLIAGRVADRYGRINVLIVLIMSAVLVIFVVLYPFSHKLSALYTFSALYGLCSGSFISLAPVCIRQVSNAKEIGMRFGTCYCLVSFATLICIPIGGEMLEKVGAQIVVIWLGCVLVFSTFLFLTARWACLEYKWHWAVKI